MTTQWGAPLTGAQMKLLMAAGLPDGTEFEFYNCRQRRVSSKIQSGVCYDDLTRIYLPADHAAYTLLEKGWLDGRNVALWFGGDKAPDDWDEGSDVLFRGGVVPFPSTKWAWKHRGADGDIIAYTCKAEYRKETLNSCQSFDETVTIAKMTEAEAAEWLRGLGWFGGSGNLALLESLGLIKPEPTRLERFWATRNTKDVYGPPCKAFQLIEEALGFER